MQAFGSDCTVRCSTDWAIRTRLTHRGKPGTKRHLAADRRGIPLAVKVSGANRQDSPLLLPLVAAIPQIRTP